MVSETELKKTYGAFLKVKDELASEVYTICCEYDETCEVLISLTPSCARCDDTDYLVLTASLDKHMPLSALVKIEAKGGSFIDIAHNEEDDCCGFCTYKFHFHLTDIVHCADKEVE